MRIGRHISFCDTHIGAANPIGKENVYEINLGVPAAITCVDYCHSDWL